MHTSSNQLYFKSDTSERYKHCICDIASYEEEDLSKILLKNVKHANNQDIFIMPFSLYFLTKIKDKSHQSYFKYMIVMLLVALYYYITIVAYKDYLLKTHRLYSFGLVNDTYRLLVSLALVLQTQYIQIGQLLQLMCIFL